MNKGGKFPIGAASVKEYSRQFSVNNWVENVNWPPAARHFNLPNHYKQHMAVCGLSLHLGRSESRKTLEQKFIFQIGTLNPHGINERFSTNLFLLSRHHIPTNSVAPLFVYKPTDKPQFLQSLWRRADAQNVNFFTLYGGQFTFSAQLLTLNYLIQI